MWVKYYVPLSENECEGVSVGKLYLLSSDYGFIDDDLSWTPVLESDFIWEDSHATDGDV